MKRFFIILIFLGIFFSSFAQEPLPIPEISITIGGRNTGPDTLVPVLEILLVLTILTLAPSILMTLTSFTRLVIVLSFLRTALGTRQAPPNQVLIALALFLTFLIMYPFSVESTA